MNVATSTANTIARKSRLTYLDTTKDTERLRPDIRVVGDFDRAGASLCAENPRPQNRHTTAPGMISSLQ